MQHWKLMIITATFLSVPAARGSATLQWVQIEANGRTDRTLIANNGVSIEAIRSDSVWGFASANALQKIEAQGLKVLGTYPVSVGRGGHEGIFDFPKEDSKYHTYKQTIAFLKYLQAENADLVKVQSIGKSVEKRDLWALHINTSPDALMTGQSTKPSAVYMGTHHAREHLSNEMPLLWAQYLLDHRHEPTVQALLEKRDIWIIPMVNPDGAEWDISAGDYKMWRKNRHSNTDGTYGVDLNRNYGFKWGTGGSSKDTTDETYMGEKPFSEPETQAIRDFVDSHSNIKVLLTFHTFSELVLYPWGHRYEPIDNDRDHAVFEKMAQTMAGWNHYTPEQSSQLYIASGDTTDWAYGTHGIFAFTFELSPNSISSGGFYPGAGIIDRVFQDNLKPCLYLLDTADNPYKVLDKNPVPFLPSLIETSDL